MATVADAKHDIQGFITSAYGHTYSSAYLFVKMNDIARAKSWLTDIIPQVQTAESWRPGEGSEKTKPERILNIAFSMDGISALGLSDTTLNSFPAEMQEGMAESARAKLLGDVEASAPEKWVVGGSKNSVFHFMVILHAGLSHEDDTSIKTYVEDISQGIDSHAMEVVHIEWGDRRSDDKEHFGFKDGIAQPKIKGIHQRDADGNEINSNIIEAGEFIMGYINQYGLYASVPVVPESEDKQDILPSLPTPGFLYDRYNPDSPLKDLGKNGSYIVYRKMKQDVALFWNYLKAEADRLDGTINPERIVWLASKFVGRYPNGNPMVSPETKLKHQDDFLYAKHDSEGMHCPFGSHIRRTNPRDVFYPTDPEVSLDTVDKHRIMRRGRIFGESLFDLALLDDENDVDKLAILLNLADDGKERGLQFFCANASIQMQFEFIQDSWANNPHFNAQYQNKDPLIGDNGTSYQRDSYMNIPHTPVRIRTSPLPRFTQVLGGAYLFMPGITALKYLAS